VNLILDDVLSQFGSDKPSALQSKSKDFDFDAILKEFDTSAPTAEAKPTERIYVSPAKPPISGVSKEASDELNRRPDNPGGANPRLDT
jgi:hypothetical protein